MQVDVMDRKSNLINFGVTEDRAILDIENILNFAACQHVEAIDTFRLGRYVSGVNH